MKKVAVIGGGLAGLVSGIILARQGISVKLFERKTYPFHRVCGEYISNEVIPFLKSHNLFPEKFSPPSISKFQLTATNGKSVTLPLDLGGFGVSRFSFDHFLMEEAVQSGVQVLSSTEVDKVEFKGDYFKIGFQDQVMEVDLVLGAFGKRSKLDVEWKRKFTVTRSPYVGVKHHLKTNHPSDLIALHNFEGGYCGISNVEEEKSNLCYLVHRDKVREAGSIAKLENDVLKKNPWLKTIFDSSEFLFDKPETINEISFETKEPVFNHILMLGDAAGMITPLCGNGMAMAIRSAKMVTDSVVAFYRDNLSHQEVEKQYSRQWTQTFSNQLWFGRQVQRLFGNEFASNLAVQLAIKTKWIANTIIRNTHGQPF